MESRKVLLCRILGHDAHFTGKWRSYCPNVGLYKCKRCGLVSMVYPPLLKYTRRMKWFHPDKYKYKTYVR